MRDIGPEGLVSLVDRIAGPRLSAWTESQSAPISSGVSSPSRRAGVQLALEFVEGDLAHTVLIMSSTLLGDQRLALAPVGGAGEKGAEVSISPKTEAVSARRQRRLAHQRALAPARNLVERHGEFVGERHDIARLPR